MRPVLVDMGLDFESLLKLMCTRTVPFSLRNRCCRLIRALHIDRDPFVPLLAPFMTHVWSGSKQPYSKAVLDIFSSLQDSAVHRHNLKMLLIDLMIEENLKSDACENRGRMFLDEFLGEIIKSLGFLLSFGFFHSSESENGMQPLDMEAIQKLVSGLIDVLDTRSRDMSANSSASMSTILRTALLDEEPLLATIYGLYIPDQCDTMDKRSVEAIKLCNMLLDFILTHVTAQVIEQFEEHQHLLASADTEGDLGGTSCDSDVRLDVQDTDSSMIYDDRKSLIECHAKRELSNGVDTAAFSLMTRLWGSSTKKKSAEKLLDVTQKTIKTCIKSISGIAELFVEHQMLVWKLVAQFSSIFESTSSVRILIVS